MKNYLTIALAIIALGAVSCKKCQTCTTRVTQNVAGINIEVSTLSEEYCGDAYDNAPGEVTVNQSVAGVTQTVTITCVDK